MVHRNVNISPNEKSYKQIHLSSKDFMKTSTFFSAMYSNFLYRYYIQPKHIFNRTIFASVWDTGCNSRPAPNRSRSHQVCTLVRGIERYCEGQGSLLSLSGNSWCLKSFSFLTFCCIRQNSEITRFSIANVLVSTKTKNNRSTSNRLVVKSDIPLPQSFRMI